MLQAPDQLDPRFLLGRTLGRGDAELGPDLVWHRQEDPGAQLVQVLVWDPGGVVRVVYK